VTVTTGTGGGYLQRPGGGSLAEVVDIILDKGMVIDVYVRVSLIGIEILTIDARIVIASVDTYLRFAEAVNRLDLRQADESEGLPQLVEQMTEGGGKQKTKGALEGVKEKVGEFFGGEDEGDTEGERDQEAPEESRSRRRSSQSGRRQAGSKRR
jgi:gas vesicle structural protein